MPQDMKLRTELMYKMDMLTGAANNATTLQHESCPRRTHRVYAYHFFGLGFGVPHLSLLTATIFAPDLANSF